MRTLSFARLAYENKKKKTRREKFLEEVNQVIPWGNYYKSLRDIIPGLATEGSRCR